MINSFKLAFATLVLIFFACNIDTQYEDKLCKIKQVGNDDPLLALRMLDSIKYKIRRSPNYIQMQYDLLEIRLKDKAYIVATSDVNIKQIMDYFDEHGTMADKREAYFYAGSIYRDLHDMPRSLEFFFRSLNLAEKENPRDSVMLRNIYSNLHCLYYGVQDYPNALKMAKMEYTYSEKLNNLTSNDAMHIGATLMQLNRKKEAEMYFVKAFNLMKDDETAIALLCQFSNLGRIDLAQSCYEKVKCHSVSPWASLSIGNFFRCMDNKDSALYYYKRVIIGDCPLEAKYDAAHNIYELDKTLTAAILFIKISDSLNLGERQQRAATINNQHQYHRDMSIEQEIKQKNEEYRYMLIIVTLCFILVMTSGMLAYTYKRYKFSKKIIMQDKKLGKLNESLKLQREEENSVKEELQKTQNAYLQSQIELEELNKQLIGIREELDVKNEELKERIEQTSDMMRMLHHSELTTKAEDVVSSIRAASEGKYNMTPSDWLRLYKAVDSMYPEFGDELVKKLKKFTEQQKQVYYLIRIGLTNTQIENITDISHATVWRWVKRYGELVE